MSPQQRNRTHSGAQVSTPAERPIFRSEALRHYQENQDKMVLPPWISTRIFLYLWILAAITMIAGLLLAFWPWLGR